jgi:hypothetical protein
MTKEPLESIASSLRKQSWILCVQSGALTILAIFLILVFSFGIYGQKRADEEARTVEVVVANTNLVSGALLARNNLGAMTMKRSKLKTKDYVDPSDAHVLFGHRLLKAVDYKEIITWANTDIVNTNETLQH